jgi:hypothetical protein
MMASGVSSQTAPQKLAASRSAFVAYTPVLFYGGGFDVSIEVT